MSIPHLFRCPISLDLFTDPVTLATGQTYDRLGIEKWLAGGNLTCPVTMQKLQDTTLVPNHTLRHLIDQWLLNVGKPTSNPGEFSLSNLKQSLHCPETLNKLRVLSEESDTGKACLIQLGFYPLLLKLMFQPPRVTDPELIELGLDCIVSLSASTHVGSLNMLSKPLNFRSLVLLLDQRNVKIKAKVSLCYLIEIISSSPIIEDVCILIGNTPEVLQALVSLLAERRVAEAAVKAIAGICRHERTLVNAIREGVVDGLVYYLCTSKKGAVRALATMEVLLGVEEGRKALVKNAGAVEVLVRMVFRVSGENEGSEFAVGALMVLCGESATARVEAVRGGLVTQLLLLLQSQCGGKAKGKARMLLKMLRAMWGRELVEI